MQKLLFFDFFAKYFLKNGDIPLSQKINFLVTPVKTDFLTDTSIFLGIFLPVFIIILIFHTFLESNIEIYTSEFLELFSLQFS